MAPALTLTTASPVAAATYTAAVADAVAGRSGAAAGFARAVAADGAFLVARAGGALVRWEAGGPPEPVPAARASRRERQHAEILGLVVAGRLARAGALLAEHGTEFPTDVLPALAVAVGAARWGDRAVARAVRARLDPGDPGLRVVAAVAALAGGDADEARALAAAALATDPGAPRAARILAAGDRRPCP